MNRNFLKHFILLFLALAAPKATAELAVPWFKIAGGGGAATGGVYSITGTSGQPDATRPLTNGSYSISGGFWSATILQSADAPWLSISTTNGLIIVSWIASAADWKLVTTNHLTSSAALWPLAVGSCETNGDRMQFVEPAVAGHKFYRLRKP
jgi:hypothetical protein